MIQFIDTHTHLDGTEFDADRDEVMERARAAGVSKVFLPAIDLSCRAECFIVSLVMRRKRSNCLNSRTSCLASAVC